MATSRAAAPAPAIETRAGSGSAARTSSLPATSVAVQLGDRRDLVAQRRDLADHVHAARHCSLVVERDELGASASWPKAECRSTPLAAMRSRPRFSRSSRSRSSSCEVVLAAQPPLLLAELVGERRRRHRVAWPGPVSSSTVSVPATAACWNRGVIAPARDGLLGEEVRGAHQHADPHAALGERRGQRGDHRGRAGVVDAAGEEHVVVRAVAAGRNLVEQRTNHRVPEDEARPRADVAAALAPLEDEPARTRP